MPSNVTDPTRYQVGQIFNRLDQVNFSQIALIAVLAWASIFVVERLLPWMAKRLSPRLRMYLLPSIPVIRLFILIIALALIIPMVIHTSLQNVIAILGLTAVALGFAFKDYVSSLLAGIVAVYERPYRVGDWVSVDGAYGEIISMNLRAFRLFTFDDTVVTIPHIKIWNKNIYNANNGKRNLLCVAHFFVNPNHDAVLVRQKLYDVALTSPYLDMDHRIRVIVQEQPWGTHYQLKAYPLDGRDQFQFISDMTVRGKAALAKMGVGPANAVPAAATQDSMGEA
ncbi:MAG: mechanosensitive ion channel family protein [Thermodesulfobacteriota bacterium]